MAVRHLRDLIHVDETCVGPETVSVDLIEFAAHIGGRSVAQMTAAFEVERKHRVLRLKQGGKDGKIGL